MKRPKGRETVYVLTYEECREVIAAMRFGAESDLFGREKDESFKGSIGNIYQSFAGQEIYESLEEKAANLLYWLQKTMVFLMVIRELRQQCFFIFLIKTRYFLMKMEKN